MEDFYFVILRKAEKRGLFNSLSVADEIKKYLKKSPVYKTKPTNWQELPSLLLNPLVERKYIGILRFEFPKINNAPDNWLDQLVAIIYILPDGLLFLYEKKKIRQQAITNSLTFIFILVTLLVGLGNFYYSNETLKITKQSNIATSPNTQKLLPTPSTHSQTNPKLQTFPQPHHKSR